MVFKALALWADAFYKLKCPSVCPSVRPRVHFGGTIKIALQGTTKDSLPQVKLGKTLNLVCVLDKNKGRS